MVRCSARGSSWATYPTLTARVITNYDEFTSSVVVTYPAFLSDCSLLQGIGTGPHDSPRVLLVGHFQGRIGVEMAAIPKLFP